MAEIIAIDGPAGAGKSSVARQVAVRLGYTYLDTGAMYRSVAWMALKSGCAADDIDGLAKIASEIHIEFGPLPDAGRQPVTVNGNIVTDAIRTPEVSGLTSGISSHSPVRQIVVEQQRHIAANALNGVVLEGRDIGTVVFPNAGLKVFLTASPEERARRRYEELRSGGTVVEYADVLKDQIDRDARDSQRAASPLTPARDAVHVNTDGKSINEVVKIIIEMHKNRLEAGNAGERTHG